MARQYTQGDELVPGFHLVELLGRGGFGEVWKASAPGGTEVAIKIIGLGERHGYKEFRAVRMVKQIRHPNLVPIIAFWLKNDQDELLEELASEATVSTRAQDLELLIAMGLGDKSLLERLRECQKEKLPGIPVEELLGYFEDAAKAIDYLNQPIHDLGEGLGGIQHCDIKPQNIMIVGGAAQVCDFGLARVLGENRATSTKGTAAYMAPELITENKPSKATDQYFLGISYVELRTGSLPINVASPAAAIWAHMQGKLDLTKLPPPERAVIQRATSVDPTKRFPSVVEMVRELRQACSIGGTLKRSGIIKLDQVLLPGQEVVPGYKLTRKLGQGGYGQVWEATAPGGKRVALKIIRNVEGVHGKQEFKALELIKGVDHNHLMEVHAYWLLDRQSQVIPDDVRQLPDAPEASILVIASKLASQNLMQRWHECHDAGAAGIPIIELLSYMQQAAQAIDYLNAPRHQLGDRMVSIQHRDIKPENILLAVDVVKVGDFGLAKVVEGTSAVIHGDSAGLTLAYAAPEMFTNIVTAWTDQYCLALTYFRLRTGEMPFPPGCKSHDIIKTHVQGSLALGRLAEAERAVIARATALIPEKRFPSCSAMVEELAQAVRGIEKSEQQAHPANFVAPLASLHSSEPLPSSLGAKKSTTAPQYSVPHSSGAAAAVESPSEFLETQTVNVQINQSAPDTVQPQVPAAVNKGIEVSIVDPPRDPGHVAPAQPPSLGDFLLETRDVAIPPEMRSAPPSPVESRRKEDLPNLLVETRLTSPQVSQKGKTPNLGDDKKLGLPTALNVPSQSSPASRSGQEQNLPHPSGLLETRPPNPVPSWKGKRAGSAEPDELPHGLLETRPPAPAASWKGKTDDRRKNPLDELVETRPPASIKSQQRTDEDQLSALSKSSPAPAAGWKGKPKGKGAPKARRPRSIGQTIVIGFLMLATITASGIWGAWDKIGPLLFDRTDRVTAAARQLVSERKFNEALDLLASPSGVDPEAVSGLRQEVVEAWLTRAQADLDGHEEDAFRAAQDIHERFPDNATADRIRLLALDRLVPRRVEEAIATGDFKRAAEQLLIPGFDSSKRPELSSAIREAWLQSVEAQRKKHQYDQSIASLRDLLKFYPDERRATKALAQLQQDDLVTSVRKLITANEFSQAMKLLSANDSDLDPEILKELRDEIFLREELDKGRSDSANERSKEALEHFERVRHSPGSNRFPELRAAAILGQARIHAQSDQWDTVAKELKNCAPTEKTGQMRKLALATLAQAKLAKATTAAEWLDLLIGLRQVENSKDFLERWEAEQIAKLGPRLIAAVDLDKFDQQLLETKALKAFLWARSTSLSKRGEAARLLRQLLTVESNPPHRLDLCLAYADLALQTFAYLEEALATLDAVLEKKSLTDRESEQVRTIHRKLMGKYIELYKIRFVYSDSDWKTLLDLCNKAEVSDGWVLSFKAECLIERARGNPSKEDLEQARRAAFDPEALRKAGVYAHYVRALVAEAMHNPKEAGAEIGMAFPSNAISEEFQLKYRLERSLRILTRAYPEPTKDIQSLIDRLRDKLPN